MPPGYHVELVASEPLIQDPVAIDWDTEGRLWAVEMPGFMADITGSNEHDPIGRVVVLEDTNADGVMDKRTVFADGLVLARSLKVLDHGVLVAEPPNVWLMHDTNGDLRMDTKELVTDQFGRRETDPENNANTFHWALDNRMYTSGQTTIQFRFKNGAFEMEKTLERGEWGVARGRCRPHLSEHERVGTSCRLRPDGIFRPQSEPAAHARKLRAARERDERPQHRVAGPPESGNQPRVPDRHRPAGRIAGEVHLRLRARGLPRRSAAVRTFTETSSWRSPRRTS